MRFSKGLSTSLFLLCASSALYAWTGGLPRAPAGWSIDQATNNVRLYRKGTAAVYVQVVNVAAGGRVAFSQPGMIQGVSYPTFSRYSMATHWSKLTAPVSAVNGQFFDPNKNPTTLSFAVKSGGTILTLGEDKWAYDLNYTPRQLEITPRVGATVLPWSEYRIKYQATAPNIIVGLHPDDTSKGPTSLKGRTVLCTTGPWVLVATYASAYQATAVNDLVAWGCSRDTVVVFDGGGSTQLKTTWGRSIAGDGRLLPQVLAVYDL